AKPVTSSFRIARSARNSPSSCARSDARVPRRRGCQGPAAALGDARQAGLPLAGALRGATRRARRRDEETPGQALRLQPPRLAAPLSGHGRRGQGRRDQARDERPESARLPRGELQAAERDRARARLPVARGARASRARPHRHLQPLVLRRGADRARASRDPRQRGSSRGARRRRQGERAPHRLGDRPGRFPQAGHALPGADRGAQARAARDTQEAGCGIIGRMLARWIRYGPAAQREFDAAYAALATVQMRSAAPILLWSEEAARYPFALIAPRRLVPGRESRWLSWGLAGVVATYRQFDVPAYLDGEIFLH